MSPEHEEHDELTQEEQLEEQSEQACEEPEQQDGTDLESELSMWKDRALRAQAEMANMRRRLDSEVEQRTRRRLESLLHDLIMVGDHIDLALGSIPEPVREAQGADGFLMGMDAIRTAFDGVLKQHGLEWIAPDASASFDPAQHEAVGTEKRDGVDETQLELMRRGYKMGNHILRPAQVRIVEPA